MAISRDTVLWGFRLILGREPESEEGIRAHLHLTDETALVETLLRSPEFSNSGRFANTIRLREGATQQIDAAWKHESRARLKVVVFGNCQAAGAGRLIQAMTGDAVAQSFETTPTFLKRLRAGEFDLDSVVSRADLVLVQLVGEVTQQIQRQLPRQVGKVRQFPPLNYTGFHPDCVYISRQAAGHLQGPMGEYQSSLAFWAWQRGLDVEQAVELFRDEVFESLGFYQQGPRARRAMVGHGRSSHLPMATLLDGWRERGCFMHSMNHPKLFALADIVGAVLRREGIVPLTGVDAWLDDNLANWPVWPVYPGIAERFGLKGDYQFKLDRGFCPQQQPVLTLSLAAFVEASFQRFAAADTGSLHCERVLGPAYEGLTRFVRERPGGLRKLTGMIAERLSPLRSAAPTARPGSPYEALPDHQFWRRAVERVAQGDVDPVVRGSFQLQRSDRVATAGSCFAQNIARTLQREGFNYLVADTDPRLPADEARQRGFGVYSARYGNVYTARQLVQLFDRAHGEFTPLDSAWLRPDGRHVDPFRPQIEPAGFADPARVAAATAQHLADVKRLFAELDVFVFTLGLTEGWRRRDDGAVFPLAPGVVGGVYDPALYEFVNFSVEEVLNDLRGFMQRLHGVNETARVVLTVSPVPLIATYENRHVLVSTVQSKSVLRVAAGALAAENPAVAYFPSYEIITGMHAKGDYFEADLRSVNEAGVAHVMRLFLQHHAGGSASVPPSPAAAGAVATQAAFDAEQRQLDAVVCDEEAIDRHRSP